MATKKTTKQTATKKTTSTAAATTAKKSESQKFKAENYAHLPTTSAKIRAMAADGATTGEIAKSGLKTKAGEPIRYQHARNVLNQVVNKDK